MDLLQQYIENGNQEPRSIDSSNEEDNKSQTSSTQLLTLATYNVNLAPPVKEDPSVCRAF
jgi:hypothetical protein